MNGYIIILLITIAMGTGGWVGISWQANKDQAAVATQDEKLIQTQEKEQAGVNADDTLAQTEVDAYELQTDDLEKQVQAAQKAAIASNVKPCIVPVSILRDINATVTSSKLSR